MKDYPRTAIQASMNPILGRVASEATVFWEDGSHETHWLRGVDKTAEAAKRVYGDRPETEGRAVYAIGDHPASLHYYDGIGVESLPECVREAVVERGLALIDGVEADWYRWKGRPEFSPTEVDLESAEVVADGGGR
jgi:hypothetical protein